MGISEFWTRFTKHHTTSDEALGRAKRREYRFEKVLGSGTYGEVRLATFLPTGQQYAVKVVKKSFLVAHKKSGMIKRETFVLGLVQHPNIISMHDVFETKDQWYIVFELATGGELFDRIVERGRFTERDAAVVMATVLNAVVYLHEQPNEIVHRDLKPENLLFLNKSPDSPLVIVDFGIAKVMDDPSDLLTTVCGSPGYTAPEVLRRVPYGKPVDIYSCGVICYTLLCGYLQETCDRIVLGKYKFDSPWWDPISELARDFVTRLMETDPNKRLTARQCLHHTWLTRNCPPGYIAHLRRINEQVLRAEFAALGLEMPSDIRTLPRRISLRPNHPLASLAALAPAQAQPVSQGQLAPPNFGAPLAAQQTPPLQQQMVLPQQGLPPQGPVQPISQLQQIVSTVQMPGEAPVNIAADPGLPEAEAPAEDDDYDPYEFLVNLEEDNAGEVIDPVKTATFRRGVLHIADESSAPTSDNVNLLAQSMQHPPIIPQPMAVVHTDSSGQRRWESMRRSLERLKLLKPGAPNAGAISDASDASEDDDFVMQWSNA
ncbi:kinase-like domain-containing protein [Hyaloraphidium curvatum]|nr:kinase-like domain-containing protein [Hyaloraphidium curvatum]